MGDANHELDYQGRTATQVTQMHRLGGTVGIMCVAAIIVSVCLYVITRLA
jgi:cell division protein FtsX